MDKKELSPVICSSIILFYSHFSALFPFSLPLFHTEKLPTSYNTTTTGINICKDRIFILEQEKG